MTLSLTGAGQSGHPFQPLRLALGQQPSVQQRNVVHMVLHHTHVAWLTLKLATEAARAAAAAITRAAFMVIVGVVWERKKAVHAGDACGVWAA